MDKKDIFMDDLKQNETNAVDISNQNLNKNQSVSVAKKLDTETSSEIELEKTQSLKPQANSPQVI